jgi:hypothetical protein
MNPLNVGPEARAEPLGWEKEAEKLWAALKAIREMQKSIEKRLLLLEARQK